MAWFEGADNFFSVVEELCVQSLVSRKDPFFET